MTYSIILFVAVLVNTSFISNDSPFSELVNTKWISPINDNCFESLCFNSERTVVYYRCDGDDYFEVGYKINGDKIEMEAYSNKSMDPNSKLVLYEDNGILRKYGGENNSFPGNFIKVPGGVCE